MKENERALVFVLLIGKTNPTAGVVIQLREGGVEVAADHSTAALARVVNPL